MKELEKREEILEKMKNSANTDRKNEIKHEIELIKRGLDKF